MNTTTGKEFNPKEAIEYFNGVNRFHGIIRESFDKLSPLSNDGNVLILDLVTSINDTITAQREESLKVNSDDYNYGVTKAIEAIELFFNALVRDGYTKISDEIISELIKQTSSVGEKFKEESISAQLERNNLPEQ